MHFENSYDEYTWQNDHDARERDYEARERVYLAETPEETARFDSFDAMLTARLAEIANPGAKPAVYRINRKQAA